MKRLSAFLLAFLLLCASAHMESADVPPLPDPVPSESGTAQIRLPLLQEGDAYAVHFSEKGIAGCTPEKGSTAQDDPDAPDASHDIVYTLTGLVPGRTLLTLTDPSGKEEHRYRVTVDDLLCVSAAPESEITSLFYSRTTDILYPTYDLNRTQNGYTLSVGDEAPRRITSETADALLDILWKYDLYAWDGFHESNSLVLDGEMFSLEITFADGSSIRAYGTNAFPQHYHDAVHAVTETLNAARPSLANFLNALLDLFTSGPAEKQEMTFGADIGEDQFREFYYTFDSSAYPPDWQRYHFSAEDGDLLFHHETRKGTSWPLTEDDIIQAGTFPLSEDEAAAFFSLLDGGTVHAREEHLETGDAGPFLYLYWDGDEGTVQEFSFPDVSARLAFEAFCEDLKARDRSGTSP